MIHNIPETRNSPAYRILTQRLCLRPWNPEDAPALDRAIRESLQSLREWMDWAHLEPEPILEKAQRIRRFRAQFDLDENFIYGIWDREEQVVLGGTGLHPRVGGGALEIGYWIHTAHQGQGLGTEAAKALTRAAFEIHAVDRVEIRCSPGNPASTAIPRKLGFTHEATLRRRGIDPPDIPADRMVWTVFASEYPETRARLIEIEAFDLMGQRISVAPQANERR